MASVDDVNPYVQRLGPDRLAIRARAEGDGDLLGDAWVEIGPDDPRYADALASLAEWDELVAGIAETERARQAEAP